jgi:hypothetical protein
MYTLYQTSRGNCKVGRGKKCGGVWRGSRGSTPPGFWTTTASVLLQVIEMKGDAKDTPVDQGVDHVDHPWPSPKQSVWRPLHSRRPPPRRRQSSGVAGGVGGEMVVGLVVDVCETGSRRGQACLWQFACFGGVSDGGKSLRRSRQSMPPGPPKHATPCQPWHHMGNAVIFLEEKRWAPS